MNELTVDAFKLMMRNASLRIKEREDEFSQLDAITGDGDHGTAINSAMNILAETVKNGTEFKTILSELGFNVMLQTSGSTSTLLGAFLLGMSDHSGGVSLDASAVKEMFAGGLKNVQTQTQAKKGDKTMMDALIPAVEAILASPSENIAEIIDAGAKAAQAGAKATVDMKANFGRARNYGERSIGTVDAGATSWACMFSAFADALL